MFGPQRKGHWRRAKRHARVAGFGLFNRVRRQKPYGINAFLFQFVFVRHKVSFMFFHGASLKTNLKLLHVKFKPAIHRATADIPRCRQQQEL